MEKSQKWLVTGGAGFIGSNFVKYALDKYPNLRVMVLDNFSYAGNRDNLPSREATSDRLEVFEGDVIDGALTTRLVEDCDVVYHFAAETHVTRSLYDSLSFVRTDILGTHSVLTACSSRTNPPVLVHISTSEVYGTAVHPLMSEDHPLNPMSPYAAAKAGADRLVYAFQKSYGLPCVILRPFNNFGPHQHLEKLLPRFITSALRGEALNIHGSGGARRDFTFVRDTCHAIDAARRVVSDERPFQVFNVASGRDHSVEQLAHLVLEMVPGSTSEIRFIEDRPGQVLRHTGDSSLLTSVTGWEPEESLETGLGKTIAWYEGNPQWWEPQLQSREVQIRLRDGRAVYH